MRSHQAELSCLSRRSGWAILFIVLFSSLHLSICTENLASLSLHPVLLPPAEATPHEAPPLWGPSPHPANGLKLLVSPPERKRFFDFRYFPFVVRRPVPDCVNDARCLSSVQCHALSGTAKGKCHKGFAVCCALEAKCGSTVRTNETFLVNDGYPSPVTTLAHCQYNIEKMNKDICQLRLDLQTLVLVGPDATSRCHLDTFSVNGDTSATPILLCGTNSGQHMYVDMGEGTSSVRVNIATAAPGAERTWRVKVTQIACSSRYRAPENCLQYFTDYSGLIKSFNYQDNDGVHQLAGHMYTTCVQAKPGFCGIIFKSNDFSLSNDGSSAATAGAGGRTLTGNADCTADFVSIFTASREGIVLPDRYCGNRFINVTTFSKPFEVRVVTDEVEANADKNNRGFLLNYVQIPC